MTHEQLKKEGWEITDGSDSTLQIGKKINSTTWLYRQWTDNPFDSVHLETNIKLSLWDDGRWVEEEIDLLDYTIERIEDDVSSFGYSVVDFGSFGKMFTLTLEDDSGTYTVEDSIQLACECIFELNN